MLGGLFVFEVSGDLCKPINGLLVHFRFGKIFGEFHRCGGLKLMPGEKSAGELASSDIAKLDQGFRSHSGVAIPELGDEELPVLEFEGFEFLRVERAGEALGIGIDFLNRAVCRRGAFAVKVGHGFGKPVEEFDPCFFVRSLCAQNETGEVVPSVGIACLVECGDAFLEVGFEVSGEGVAGPEKIGGFFAGELGQVLIEPGQAGFRIRLNPVSGNMACVIGGIPMKRKSVKDLRS